MKLYLLSLCNNTQSFIHMKEGISPCSDSVMRHLVWYRIVPKKRWHVPTICHCRFVCDRWVCNTLVLSRILHCGRAWMCKCILIINANACEWSGFGLVHDSEQFLVSRLRPDSGRLYNLNFFTRKDGMMWCRISWWWGIALLWTYVHTLHVVGVVS